MRPEILLVTTRLPFPLSSGERIRKHHFLLALSRLYRTHLVSICESNPAKEDLDFLSAHTASFRVFVRTRSQRVIATAASLVNRYPLQVNYYYYSQVQAYVNSFSGKVSLAAASLIRSARYVENFTCPKLLDMVDSIGLNYLNSKTNTKSQFWRIVYGVEAARLMAYERECVAGFDFSLFCNKDEAQYWAKQGNAVWLPHGVRAGLTGYNSQFPDYAKDVCFFGTLDYQPNIDAVLWFTENVLPYIDAKSRFIVIGANPGRQLRRLAEVSPRVVFTGFLSDPYGVIQSCACAVAPMLTGGGVQFKVLESMALGQIVVCSSLAAKPIEGAVDGTHLVVSDASNKMAADINDIVTNPGKYAHIRINAREMIEHGYSWDSYNKCVERLVDNLIIMGRSASLGNVAAG